MRNLAFLSTQICIDESTPELINRPGTKLFYVACEVISDAMWLKPGSRFAFILSADAVSLDDESTRVFINKPAIMQFYVTCSQ